MTRAAALWILLALFVARVLGQLAVSLDLAPFLPPMDQWQSGLLPYPALLTSQIVLVAGLVLVCVRFARGVVRRRPRLGTPLWIAGWIYALSMVVRYAVWMTDLIPVFFHIVLASFLLVVADYHRRAS
jgi:hypothetical protein